MRRMDRREFLERAGGFVVVAGFPGPFRLAENLRDPRLRELDRLVQGDVLGRADAGYDAARQVYSSRVGTQPFAIAYAESARDVQRTILWARRHKLRIAPRSGGHSYGGYSLSPGVVVDVSLMNRIAVGAGQATVGAGAKLYDVYATLAGHGVTVPAGSCPTVGIAGLALGGGIGLAARKLGLTCDSLREVRIVTADGKALVANARQHSDLFWASRGGGGGNFGIATSFVFRTHPVGNVVTYTCSWPWAAAAKVIAAWQAWAPHAPPELMSLLDLSSGGPNITSGGQYFGSEAQLRAQLAQLFASSGQPTGLTVRTRSYLEAQRVWANCRDAADCHSAAQATFKAKSDYANKPIPAAGARELIDAMDAHHADPRLGSAAVLFDAHGGAINRVPKAATAFVHRNALFSIQYIASWETNADANLAWIRKLHSAMRPYVSGFAYQNYIDPELATWKRAYYGSNLERLARVKRKYDPKNVFRFAQSIPIHV
jgi:FAD/FMN-containing dehydrogenase